MKNAVKAATAAARSLRLGSPMFNAPQDEP